MYHCYYCCLVVKTINKASFKWMFSGVFDKQECTNKHIFRSQRIAHPSRVCPSICPSVTVGVLLKRLNIGSHKNWSPQPFASTVVNFQLPQIHLKYPTCIGRLRWGWSRFAEIFGIRKLENLGYHVACLRDPTSSHFSRTPTCDRRTDTQWHPIPMLASIAWLKTRKNNHKNIQ